MLLTPRDDGPYAYWIMMIKMERSSISPINFLLRTIGVSAGLVVLANLLASGFNLQPGLVTCFLGILSIGVGNLLSLPARRYERLHGIRHINLFKLPAPEEYIAGNLLIARHALPFCSFENALLLAGFIVLLIGLFLLF